jgi:hypothetical protein
VGRPNVTETGPACVPIVPSHPYNVTINPDWYFTMEVPYESITGIDEGGGAPEIESEGIAETQGAQAAGGVLGNVDGCVHPKPEG